MEIENIPEKYFLDKKMAFEVMKADWKSYGTSREVWELRKLEHKEYDRICKELEGKYEY